MNRPWNSIFRTVLSPHFSALIDVEPSANERVMKSNVCSKLPRLNPCLERVRLLRVLQCVHPLRPVGRHKVVGSHSQYCNNDDDSDATTTFQEQNDTHYG